MKFPEQYRTNGEPSDNGAFVIPIKTAKICVIASSGMDWDHVSASMRFRCPTWGEMCIIKRLFFRDDEEVMQLHPPLSNYKNLHPYCLHLWRPHHDKIPMPPLILV